MSEQSKTTRRQFFKRSAATVAVVGVAKQAQGMEFELGNHSYNYIKRGEERKRVFSCSPLTPHDNPVEAWLEDDRMTPANPLTGKHEPQVVEISGITESVRSRGRVSAAEASAWLQLTDSDRLLTPLKRTGKRGAGQWQEISWQQALKEIAEAIKASPPEAIALLHGKDTSAGAWQHFLHTLGSNTRINLDGSFNKKAAWQALWNAPDSIPDLAHSHYILNFGSNFMVSYPNYAADAMDGRVMRRAKIVSFDPRCSKTAGLSDEWIPVKPGTDGIVALAMVRYLLKNGWVDDYAIRKQSDISIAALKRAVDKYTLQHAEAESGASIQSMSKAARELYESKRGCVVIGAGVSDHANGFDTVRAISLLSLVTGNLESQGGNCQPRMIDLGKLQPAPDMQTENPVKRPARFPLDVGTAYSANVLFHYHCNPAFDATGSYLWRNVLKDKTNIPLIVAIGTFKNETAELADIILPEAHWLERNEPVQSVGDLLPWVGLRQQVVKAPGQAKELRYILRDIIHAIGNPDMNRFWQFRNTNEWMQKQLDGVAGLKRDGGWKLMAKHSGFWPIYGYLHPEKRRIVDEQGEEVMPEYGKPVQLALSPFPHWQQAADTERDEDMLTLIIHASDYHADDASANNKIIAETSLANHLLMNYDKMQELGLNDGELVRVTSAVAYLVTRVRVTQMIFPDVVAMHRDGGHWSIGGVAAGSAGPKQAVFHANSDNDINHNLWWSDMGVHPTDLIAPLFDAAGGGAMATSVHVEKAQASDKYGEVHVDAGKMMGVGQPDEGSQNGENKNKGNQDTGGQA